MKQATTKTAGATQSKFFIKISKRLKEGAFIIFCSLAIYLFIALATYNSSDPGWSHFGMSQTTHNAAGKTGAWLSDILYSLFGYMAYLFPCTTFLVGVMIYRDISIDKLKDPFMWTLRILGLLIVTSTSCGLISMHLGLFSQELPMSAGGVLGAAVQELMVSYLNLVGGSVILSALLLAGITLLTGLSWLNAIDIVGKNTLRFIKGLRIQGTRYLKKTLKKLNKVKNIVPQTNQIPKLLPILSKRQAVAPFTMFSNKDGELSTDLTSKDKEVDSSGFPFGESFSEQDEEEFPSKPDILSSRKRNKLQKFKSNLKKMGPKFKPGSASVSKPVPNHTKASTHKSPTSAKKNQADLKPSLTLLHENHEKDSENGSADLEALSKIVEARLLEFGVQVKVVGVHPGPVITRFELDLAAGLKVSKISGLAKDLARSLSVVSVRVVEVIPGKSVVGLEIPNNQREIVRLKEILQDDYYQQAKSPLSLGLGKDISGRPVVVNLAKMPHLLVAGTTGSGKSVGINAMLLSILYKASPEDVRLILIDPKMLELAVYADIPHLLTPVVTDMKDAANSLRWCVAEMERRYQLMAAVGVRNLTGYNAKVTAALKANKPIMDPLWNPQLSEKPDPLEALPFIVVVIDEFADMMMVVGKKVEELIARIAQKARAAGIHLILATQRPSVDVITGLIKANIPTRIAFQVSSRIDSRTILDQHGAEQLLGNGDMLYLPPGVGIPHRIHGAFVADEEVHCVAEQLRQLAKPDYVENVVQSMPSMPRVGGDDELDELYDQAVVVVTESRKASISLVQRRLKIGYNRAARLIEHMETEGVVSATQSNGTREVLAPPPVE